MIDPENYKDELLVAEYEDDHVFMETGIVGFVSYMIYVYGKEGKIPHFHILKKSENFECCVCIYEPKYFDHEGKYGRLTNKERKKLHEFMSSPSKRNPNVTNWQNVEQAWEYANGDMNKRMSSKSKQPDYSKMTESVHK